MMIIKQKKIYKVNPDADLMRLNEIAFANNERIAHGEETTITLGHTSSDDPELITIPVGYADNFVVMGEGLYCDFNIDDIWSDQITKYNKVSVELWEDNIITPIALLAINRPALEVGLIKYDMPNRGEIEHQPYITEEGVEPEVKEVENMSPAEIQQLFIETLEHSEFKCKFDDIVSNIVPKLQETVKKIEDTLSPLLAEELEEEGEVPGVEGEEGETASPEGEGTEEVEVEGEEGDKGEAVAAVEAIESEHAGKAEEVAAEKEVEKNDMASASANDTYIPDLGDKKKKDKEDVVKRYQMECMTALKEKEEVASKYDEMVKKYQLEVRKNELNELSKTYFFSAADEVDMVSKMNDEQWNMHKQIIATKYQKASIGRTVSVAPDVERNVATPDKVQRAIKMATSEGIDFKTALERCK